MSIKYRLAGENVRDSECFCSLYNSTYSKKIDNQYYLWQFFLTPFPTYLFFAEISGVVVGSMGVQVKLLSPHERNVLSVIDMMVSLQCRGKGIFSGLMKTAMQFGERFSPICAIVMANQVGKDAICGSLGWNLVTALETEQVILNENSIEMILPSDNVIHQSYRNLSEMYPADLYHISHDTEYYQWRFLAHPFYDYTLLNNASQAYSILKVFESPESCVKYGDIIEIVGKETNSIKEVGLSSLKKFSIMGVLKITTWLQTNTLWDEIGRDLGFQSTGELRYFCVNTFGKLEGKLLDSESWLLQPSDTEIY